MRPIFDYLDYRTFLGDYYDDRKRLNSRFSYQRFADVLGFRSKDFIFRVIKRQKNLSERSVGLVCKGLKLRKAEREYFASLVQFCQAKDSEQKSRAYRNMRRIMKRSRRAAFPQLIEHQQLELFSTWYYVVIRSLIEMNGCDGDYASLAASCHPPIQPRQAKHAVLVLERLGLVTYNTDTGSYSATCKSLTTGEDVLKHALVPFYREMLNMGSNSLEDTPRSERNISGLTVGISRKTYDKITQRIQEFRGQIQQIVDEDDEADRVYELALLLFPLSDRR